MNFTDISVGLAFLAGLASFLSPCVFSLVPAYIGYLGGRSVASAHSDGHVHWITFSHGVAFVLGFSTIFILLGIASSAIGGLLYDLRVWLARIGGIVVIIFGLHMIGVFRIRFLEYDVRMQSTSIRNQGFLPSFLMGIFFSAGWSPCVGPILGAILTLALNEGAISKGAILLSAYSAGLAIPFLIASLQIGLVTTVLRRYAKIMRYTEIVMGVILIIVGVMLFFGRFELIARYSNFFGMYDEVALGRLLLIVIAVLTFLGLLPAYLAKRKGRNFLTWWFFGATLFPVALPLACILTPTALSTSNNLPQESRQEDITHDAGKD